MNMTTAPKTIVLIHGLWLTALSWEHWVERFSARGYNVVARSWPGMDDIQSLRRDPSAIAHLGVTDIVEHYAKIIEGLDAPPIIIGHSFGGLITQILLDRGLGRAGVSLDSAPVKGIFKLPWSAIKSSLPGLQNPANNHRAVALTPAEFHYAFTNRMEPVASAAAYERYAVPGPGHVLFQAALANFTPHAATAIDFTNDHRAPLLIVAGSADHVSPPAINRKNFALQSQSKALTAYKEFPDRGHFLLGQKGWEEVADFAVAWANEPVEIEAP